MWTFTWGSTSTFPIVFPCFSHFPLGFQRHTQHLSRIWQEHSAERDGREADQMQAKSLAEDLPLGLEAAGEAHPVPTDPCIIWIILLLSWLFFNASITNPSCSWLSFFWDATPIYLPICIHTDLITLGRRVRNPVRSPFCLGWSMSGITWNNHAIFYVLLTHLPDYCLTIGVINTKP